VVERIMEERTYDRDPVHEMGVVAKVVDEVCCNTHHDDGADEVQNVVRSDERTVHLVRANSGRAVVGVCVSAASHFDMLDSGKN
jgi:hypothetical protein